MKMQKKILMRNLPCVVAFSEAFAAGFVAVVILMGRPWMQCLGGGGGGGLFGTVGDVVLLLLLEVSSVIAPPTPITPTFPPFPSPPTTKEGGPMGIFVVTSHTPPWWRIEF